MLHDCNNDDDNDNGDNNDDNDENVDFCVDDNSIAP